MTSGILLVDKQPGMTSHDVVARTRRLAGTRKVGHAGTLDPMATGLLLLGIDSSTRLLTYLVGLDKVYEASILLGASTTTDDAEGDVVATASTDHLGESAIREALGRFVGEIDQVPSSVSAIKVDGRRAYDLVRAGETVELKSRRVTISGIEVLAIDGPRVDVRVACSSGTYIRAIARDLGDALGVGGHLTALRRTAVGPFDVADAVTLVDGLDVGERMLHPAAVATTLFPRRDLDAQESIDLANGKRIPAADAPADTPIAAVAPSGALVGLVQRRGDTLKALVNFPSDEVAGQRS